MTKIKTSLVALLATLAVGQVHAMDLGVTASAGTKGLGLHATMPLTEGVNLRLGGNHFNYSTTVNTSSVKYDTKLKLNTLDALVDWYPTQSQFRLTGGLVYNGNKFSVNGQPTSGTYTLNSN